jgi:hypothetical protein
MGLMVQVLFCGNFAAQDTRRLIGGFPGPAPVATLIFMVENGELVPGSSGAARISTLKAIPLVRGHLVIRFEPAVFIDNPVLRFERAVPEGSFSLTTLAAGTYAIDFDSPGAPLNIKEGVFLRLSGTVKQDLPIGGSVSVGLEASATAVGGESQRVVVRGGTMLLVAEEEEVVLHVADASELVPGSTVDVRISTYNPKPISQGQVDLAYDTSVFQAVNSVTVIGADPDVSFTTDLTVPGVVRVNFWSPSASINRLDGPMITVRMTLAPDLPPGLETSIDIVVGDTFILGQQLLPVPIDSESGRFRVASAD